MIERFNGEAGRRRLISALLSNRLVCHDSEVAEALAEAVSVLELPEGHHLITQDAGDNDIYFILAGSERCQWAEGWPHYNQRGLT